MLEFAVEGRALDLLVRLHEDGATWGLINAADLHADQSGFSERCLKRTKPIDLTEFSQIDGLFTDIMSMNSIANVLIRRNVLPSPLGSYITLRW